MQAYEVKNLRHVYIVTAATLVALVLLWSSPHARGAAAEPQVDEDPGGAPYTAGQLLVTYEPEASKQDVDEAVEESDARVEEDLPAPDAQVLSFPEAQDEPTEAAREKELRQAKETLARDPDVKYVDYNYLRLPAFAPNDPLFAEGPDGSQWDLYKINAPAAWDTVMGRGARVAVVDTGIAADHPDLKAKIAAQKDVVDNDNVAEDSVGHGTHVAGTIAAATDNGVGVAGVCPKCKLLVAKSGGQTLLDSDVVQGIYWSVDNHAKVINLSLGSYGNSRILEHAVDYAWQHGVVVVAAAGNDGTDKPSYPAAYDRVISVAATDKDDVKARFSNYGKIDVAAPGKAIFSTVPGGYGVKEGTSMASPHVAGLAGLLASQGRKAPEIRRRIQSTAVDLGAAGKDKFYGWGRIDARRAVIKR